MKRWTKVSRYKEIILGLQKIRKSGGCYVITIPKRVIEEHKLRSNSKLLVILLKKKPIFDDELKEGEQLVRMSNSEHIAYQQWKQDTDF